jgi:hypothetical protein
MKNARFLGTVSYQNPAFVITRCPLALRSISTEFRHCGTKNGTEITKAINKNLQNSFTQENFEQKQVMPSTTETG